jgi:hypothetical protein
MMAQPKIRYRQLGDLATLQLAAVVPATLPVDASGLYPLLGTGARNAKGGDGTCKLCRRPFFRGDRVARIPGTADDAHTACLALGR